MTVIPAYPLLWPEGCCHPDVGGSEAAMSELNIALAAARAELL